MVGPWGAVPGIDSTARIYTQVISNRDGVFLSLFCARLLHAASCKGRLLFLYLSSFLTAGKTLVPLTIKFRLLALTCIPLPAFPLLM